MRPGKQTPDSARNDQEDDNRADIVPSTMHKTPMSQRQDLPSWLTDQPTATGLPAMHPSLARAMNMPVTPVPPGSTPAEWQGSQDAMRPSGPPGRTTEPVTHRPITRSSEDTEGGHLLQTASPEWSTPGADVVMQPQGKLLQEAADSSRTGSLPIQKEQQVSGKLPLPGATGTQRALKRNYAALVASLQTLAYSIPGFVAAALVNLDGQPIAQVAVDELDISQIYGHLSTMFNAVLVALKQGGLGEHEDTVVTSRERHLILRLIGNETGAFQVLITTREADPIECLQLMSNVEGAITAALYQ
jgi:predicted regulator of Ras-like GTPase activity (Roadblock/LC7/MglB family)